MLKVAEASGLGELLPLGVPEFAQRIHGCASLGTAGDSRGTVGPRIRRTQPGSVGVGD